MSWNHRVIHKEIDGYHTYAVHDVYYDKNGKIWACTEEPVAAFGETLEELNMVLIRFIDALSKPTLEYDSIPEEGSINPML